jgi:8-oxo-dGTP diphosphatase
VPRRPAPDRPVPDRPVPDQPAPDRPRPADEQAFLDAYDPGAFERPSVAVDVAALTLRDRALWVLLVRRTGHPFRGAWALPGAFLGPRETLDAAAGRALRAKAGLDGVYLEQLYTFSDPDRDPRTRVVGVAYYALVRADRLEPSGLPDGVSLARVHPEDPRRAEVPSDGVVRLAFDHAEILALAVRRLRGKLEYAPVGFELLPERFTLRDLQGVHETILGRPLNKDSFRRRMLESGALRPTGEREIAPGHRPAGYYTLDRAAATDGGPR